MFVFLILPECCVDSSRSTMNQKPNEGNMGNPAMIDFPRSFFTWQTFPVKPDPYFKYAGGFIGKEGDVRHVRFNLESLCTISDGNGKAAELFVGAPCRSEYTIPRREFFQIPSDEFRMAFSRTHQIPIAKRPSGENEPAASRGAQRFLPGPSYQSEGVPASDRTARR